MSKPAAAIGAYVASPISSFLWAAIWLLTATFGFIALFAEWGQVITAGLKGQRTEGFLLFTPLLSLSAAILCIIIGVRRAPKYRAFRDQLSAKDRAAALRRERIGAPWRGPLALGIAFAAVSCAGLVLLTVLLTRGTSLSGVSVLLVLLLLFLMGTVVLLRAGIGRFVANRPTG